MTERFYRGARIFDHGRLLSGFALHLEKGRSRLLPEAAIPAGAPVKDLDGGILSPGFVETQANGGGGVLVNQDYSAQGLETVFKAHRQFGTVAILPTFITDSQAKYHQAIAAIADAVKNKVPGIIGGHFEGPFLNPEKKGTHNPRYIRRPDESDYACYAQHAEYLQHSILSLAPECQAPGTLARIKPFIPQLNMAHSMAAHTDLIAARAEGLTGITHLYNAMRPMSGRDPGPIGSAAELGLACGIIADGIHSHPFALAHAYRALGAEKLLLVTDSMHTIGAPHIREFDLMGVHVYVQEDRLVNEHGSLAGAHITLLQCLQNAVRHMQADIASALQMAVSSPAYYLRRPDLAGIEQRAAADILYLDQALNLHENWR